VRPIWKGAISFGMVSVPVKMYGATEDRDIHFRLLHRADAAPVVEKRFCTAEDREVPWDQIARGYEVAPDEYVVVEPAELEAMAPESAHTIEIDEFVELDEIDPLYFDKGYYLEPEEVGARPFELLRQALHDTGRVALGRVAIRTREKLATLRVYADTIVLETMFWPDEIRSTSGLAVPDEERRPSAKERQMARSLVESLSAEFRPAEHRDRYREAVERLVEQKMHGHAPRAPRRSAAPKVTDLMEALQASVRAAREARGAQDVKPTAAGGREGRTPARTPARSGAREERRASSARQRKRPAA
jgi:Ku protein